MLKFVIKIEGCGNGIKMNLVNMVDVVKVLVRYLVYMIKYFGCEFGV